MISLSINVSVVLERRNGGAIVMTGSSYDLGSPGAQ